MDSRGKQMSRAQEKAKSYIEEHQIEKTISEMLNSLVHARESKPIIFMIKYLASMVTEQELRENGIEVQGKYPQRVPIITYPKFDDNCNSLLKKHLTREIWSNMKKKKTAKEGNIQLCVKSGVTRPDLDRIGVMATDEECYKCFSDLFGPIIKDLHQKFDYRYDYNFQDLKLDQIQEKLNNNYLEKMTYFKFQARRNFRNVPFTPLMTREAKLQIERKVVEVLGELYGQYHQLSKLEDDQKEWIQKITNIEKDEIHDAAGVNDDWPVGRGVFINEQKTFIVLVNFEDHLHFVVMNRFENDNARMELVKEGIQRLFKLIQTFEKIGYAIDSYLGNISVSPQNLGTSIQLECELQYEFRTDLEINQDLLDEIYYEKYTSVKKEYDKQQLFLQTNQMLVPNMNEITQFRMFFEAFNMLASQDISEKKEEIEDEKQEEVEEQKEEIKGDQEEKKEEVKEEQKKEGEGQQ